MKVFIKGILAIALVVSVLIVPKSFYKELNTDEITDEMYKRREKYFYGVINLWQIDSFEGGTGSRANWLKNICSGFEKRNNGVYINVESVSVEMAVKLIKSGQKKPDMISYGAGVFFEEDYFEILDIGNNIDVTAQENAVPWCMGAYFMIGDILKENWGIDGGIVKTKKGEKEIFSVGVPQREGHNGEYALLKNCENNFDGEYALYKGSSQEIFEAYNYSQKVKRMVGTQRDLYRLQSLEKRELARKGDVLFLGMTDLFQYVSVFKCEDEKKLKTIKGFIDYLIESSQQDKLGSIGMFPVNFEAEPQYENLYMQNAWQEIKNNGIECITEHLIKEET